MISGKECRDKLFLEVHNSTTILNWTMEWDMGPPQTHYFCLLLSQISLYYFLSRLINSPLMVACSLMIPDKLMFSLLQTHYKLFVQVSVHGK